MGKNNLIVDAKDISSIFKNYLADEKINFVFSTDVVMNSWIDWCVMNPEESGVSAVPLERFIAWDNFKGQFLDGGEENKTAIPALLRKLFVNNLLAKNKEQHFFKKIISPEYSDNYSAFTNWISDILPSLKLWCSLKFPGQKLSFETQNQINETLDEEDQDFLSLFLLYSEFLENNKMFEPAWTVPDFSSVDKKFVIIYPELLEDYADFIDIFSKTEDFIIVNLPKIEKSQKGPECLAYSDSRKELRRTVLKIRELVESGKAEWTEIALNIPDLETYRPYVEREFEKYCVPYVIKAGETLSTCSAGLIFSQISECYSNDFSFDSVRQLLLNEFIPWKENIKKIKENLIREGQNMHCICSYYNPNSNVINDCWLEALNATSSKNNLELNFYKTLKNDIEKLFESSSFENILKAWVIFKEHFLEESDFSETANNILSTCINRLKDLIQIEKDYLIPLKLINESPYSFFIQEIDTKQYTPQTQKVGVNVYKYKLSAAANIKYQFVIDASQKNLELPYKRLSFLNAEKRKQLGIEKEDKYLNVSKLFIELYAKSNCYFSYAEDSFSGFAIAHNYFSPWQPKSKGEKENGPFAELDSKDFILREKELLLSKQKDFPSELSISENQKNQFNTWFNRRTTFNPQEKESKLLQELITEYLTTNRKSKLPSITQSDLKDFFPCPRNWFFNRIIKLQEDSLDTELMTPFTIGNINHRILELFFKWCITNNKRKIPCSSSDYTFSDEDSKLIYSLLNEFIDKIIFEEYSKDYSDSPLTKLCLASQKNEIINDIFTFLEIFCAPLDKKGFGNSSVAYAEEWITTTEESSPDKKWVYSGKIDCVIIDENEEVYIIDFKSGSTPKIKDCKADEYGEGILVDFQIPQYITLMNSLQENSYIQNALFYSIKEKKKTIIVEPSEKKAPRASSTTIENYQNTIQIFHNYSRQFYSKISSMDLEPKKDEQDIYNNVDPYTTCIDCAFKQICRTTYSIK